MWKIAILFFGSLVVDIIRSLGFRGASRCNLESGVETRGLRQQLGRHIGRRLKVYLGLAASLRRLGSKKLLCNIEQATQSRYLK